ncbi:head-tail joining protein [Klebsiella pneumoniae]|uniref:head-tail joining protein n=1 Tax=Klebsiella pneumoniae TaxID=573 RepID=UPI002730B58F|nr:head-tail joining protein [Klebsiella pneumoniae]MDP0873486.1 head-tail joining protein [Klebsiella pneumoniae]MDP1129356.1 head-tail joining protein [Klebsiella pneumoniae]MDP1490299.1 head-tail joining protein [Klebsiella pneumoniae]
MPEQDNLFDEAMAFADRTIIDAMGTEAEITTGGRRGERIRGVFEDPENISFATSGVRVEGSSPVFFVLSTAATGLKRHDALSINGEAFWIDRVSPDDCGSCHLWLERGTPPATARRR